MATNPSTTALDGLFSRFPESRFWAYIAFALVCLLVSMAANLLVYKRIPEELVEDYTGWIGWVTASLGLVGTAFGFTAASNVGTSYTGVVGK